MPIKVNFLGIVSKTVLIQIDFNKGIQLKFYFCNFTKNVIIVVGFGQLTLSFGCFFIIVCFYKALKSYFIIYNVQSKINEIV